MTYQLLGIVGAVAFVIGLILEIPSGAIADTIGRKKIIVVSLLFLILSGILLTSATNALFLIGGVIFLQFGVSFLSGTLEALLYDNMKDSGIADRFDIVISRGIVLGILGVAVSIFVGGYVYDLGNRLPYMFWTLSSLVALIAAFYLKDSQKYDEKDMAESWLVNFKDGIYELVKPNNRYISFSILTTFGVFYYFDWGFYKSVIAIENGMSAFVQSSVFSTSNIIATIFISSSNSSFLS
jgi:MFS family permease